MQLAKKKHWYDLALIHAMFTDQGSHYNMVDWAGSRSWPSGPWTSYMVTLSPTQLAPSIYEEEVPLE